MTESSFDDAVARGEEAARRALAKHKDTEDVVVALDAYDVETAARDALEAGLCVIRASTDGKKQPVGDWKHWQDRLPSQAQVATWFGDGHPAMGIVTGKVSDNLEMLEFEGRAVDAGVVGRFRVLIREAGLWGDWERIARGYSEKTPSGGYHVLWRCERIAGNTPLARRPSTDAELEENAEHLVKVLIETRGEGGFVVCAPTTGAAHPSGIGWTREHGSFATIATIHPELRDRIFAIARQLDEMPEEAPRVRPQGDDKGDGGTLPDFDLTCEDVVKALRFQFHHTDRKGNQHWTRPGKDIREGSSLTIWADDGRATPWSSSINAPAEFVTGSRQLTPWQLHVALRHQGDFQGAARAWRRSHPAVVREVSLSELQPPPGVDPETGELLPDASWSLPAEFWEARPALGHIRDAAHSRRRSADACLHIVLARLSAIAPHTVLLPAVVGAPAPLSYFAAIVAAPGVGKSSANDIAGEIVPAPEWVADQLPLGSGEGLAEVLFDLVEEDDGKGKTRQVKRQVRHNAFVFVDEGQVLGDIGGRSGATLLPTLRTIWTGGTFGNTNASIERRRIVPARSYAYGVVAAFQASKAGALLDDAGAGTPQRFGWASAIDPTIPDVAPEWPGALPWERPALVETGGGLKLSEAIRVEIDAKDLARARGEVAVEALDAHAGLYQLKVAGLLTILDGRREITDDDWALAAMVKATSDAVRDSVLSAVAAERLATERATSSRYAERHVTAIAAEERRRIVDCARRIATKVKAEPERWTRVELYRAMKHWRTVFEEGLDHAIAEGWVSEIAVPSHTGDDKRCLRPGREGVEGWT